MTKHSRHKRRDHNCKGANTTAENNTISYWMEQIFTTTKYDHTRSRPNIVYGAPQSKQLGALEKWKFYNKELSEQIQFQS